MNEMKSLTLNGEKYDCFVDQLARELAAASAVIKSATGESITVSDASDIGLYKLNIYGKTMQDRTPTPEEPVELVSVGDVGSIGVSVATGKNILAKPFLLGVHSMSGYSNANDRVISTDGFYLKSGIYVISGAISDSWTLYINGMVNTTTTNGFQRNIPGRVFDIPDNGLYNVQFNRGDGNAFTEGEIQALNRTAQVEIGSTPTPYEPYKGQILTISTPNGLPGIPVTTGGNYTDENGQQWICDEVDFARGVYVHRTKKIEVNGSSAEGWYVSNIQYVEGATRFDINIPDEPRAGGFYCLCNAYAGSVAANTGAETCWCVGDATATHLQFRICTSYASTVDELKAILQANPVTFIYQLATPIETPLSAEEIAAYSALHTYRNHTTVSNDASAHMDLEYVMDAKKYIDSLMAGGIHPATVE